MQCCTLGGSTAILGNRPWYVGPASTCDCDRSLRVSGPTNTTLGPKNLTKCQPVPVMVKRSMSVLTARRISWFVWCWKRRYMSVPNRPRFLTTADVCMYSG